MYTCVCALRMLYVSITWPGFLAAYDHSFLNPFWRVKEKPVHPFTVCPWKVGGAVDNGRGWHCQSQWVWLPLLGCMPVPGDMGGFVDRHHPAAPLLLCWWWVSGCWGWEWVMPGWLFWGQLRFDLHHLLHRDGADLISAWYLPVSGLCQRSSLTHPQEPLSLPDLSGAMGCLLALKSTRAEKAVN